MTAYVLVFFILALIAIAMECRLSKTARIALVLFSYCLLLLFVGLRWQTGNDWFPYSDYYSSLHSIKDNADEFEIGYRSISFILKSLGMSYQCFLIVYSAIYLGLIVLGFSRDCLPITGWLFLLFYSTFLLGWMGTARQVMALSICIYSIRYIIRRHLYRFILCVAIACSFHLTAASFLLAWPVAKLRITRLRLAIAAIVCAGAALFNLCSYAIDCAGATFQIPYLSDKLTFYQRVSVTDMNLDAGDLTTLWYLKRLVTLGLFVMLFKFFRDSDFDQLAFKLYILSVLMFLLLFGSVPMIPLRAGLYFSVFELFLLASLTKKIRQPGLQKLYCCLLVVIAATRLYSALFLYHPQMFIPYKSQFINEEVVRPG